MAMITYKREKCSENVRRMDVNLTQESNIRQ